MRQLTVDTTVAVKGTREANTPVTLQLPHIRLNATIAQIEKFSPLLMLHQVNVNKKTPPYFAG
ncbi:hypothetical protein KKE26_09025 [bacterium]|nr:hypothetical protein [bacterium]